MKLPPACSLFALTLLATPTGHAKDSDKFDHGEKLHQSQCVQCHSDKVYTRKDRKVRTMEALDKQVQRCKENTGKLWFDTDTDAVVHFLNQQYYKF